jgi:hypothetical protein
VATKRGKSSASKKAPKRSPKPAEASSRKVSARASAKPAAKPPAAKPAGAKAAAAREPRAAPARPATSASAAGPSLLQRATQLRDDILRSKLTHPDPLRFAGKARAWGERAQALVDEIAAGGGTAASQPAVEALAAEIEGDRDFQEARRLF